MIQCPRCMGTDISPVGNTHYVCNNKKCTTDSGARTQFTRLIDEKVHFPYNQIFVTRSRTEFYRQPYLQIKDPGLTSLVR